MPSTQRTIQGCPTASAPRPLDDLSVPSSHARPHRRLSFAHLNHSDPEELLAHRSLFPLGRLWPLQTGLRKSTAGPEQSNRPHDNYPANLCLIATSGWDVAGRYCLCGGIRNSQGYRQPCRLWNLCAPCSYWRRKKAALSAYLTRFRRTSWFLVTISYELDLGDGILDEDTVRTCWQAAEAALRDLQQVGGCRGFVSRLEMHLERFLPLQYLPHLHAVVDADQIDRQSLAERVFAYRHPATGEGISFPVSIHDRPLRSEKAFANALSYLGKAIDMAGPYRAAWPRAVANGRRLAPALNQEVDDFLDGLSAFTSDAHQIRYSGTCRVASRRSLRVPRAQQAAERETLEAILADCASDPWDDDDQTSPADIYQPPAQAA